MAIPVIPAFGQGSEYHPFGYGSLFSSPAESEANYGYLVGPILLKLQKTPTWLILISALGLLFLIYRSLRPSKEAGPSNFLSIENGTMHFILNLLVTLIVATATITFVAPYALKLRFGLMLSFIVPLAAVTFLLIFREISGYIKLSGSSPSVLGALIAVLLLSQPWAYVLPLSSGNLVSPNSEQPITKPVISWDAIDYLRQNAPIDSKVVFLGFTQYTGCLSERRCFEVSPESTLEKARNVTSAYSRQFSVVPMCRRDVKKTGFLQYEDVSCDEGFDYNNICNFDYIVVGFFPYASYPDYPRYLLNLTARLSGNYQPVFQKGLYAVYKQSSHDVNCLPAI